MQKDAFFLDASRSLRDLFESSFVSRTLQAGETLFEQGDHDDRLYVLDDGVLEVSVYSSSGRKLSLNLLRAGSVFGEIAMFDPGPRTAHVAAIETSRLRAISQATVLRGIDQAPELAIELLGFAGKRMRWLSQQVEHQVFLPPAARLAAKVLHLAGDEGEITMSQAQLADYVGVTREVVSRTLAEWQRAGLVTQSRGRLCLLDPAGLAEVKDTKFF